MRVSVMTNGIPKLLLNKLQFAAFAALLMLQFVLLMIVFGSTIE